MTLPSGNILKSRDVRNVHLTYPRRVTVTFTPRNPTGSSITVKDVPKEPLTQSQIAGLGPREGRNRRYVLPKVNMSNLIPVDGDHISDTEDGTNWIILSIRYRIGDWLYDCTCAER